MGNFSEWAVFDTCVVDCVVQCADCRVCILYCVHYTLWELDTAICSAQRAMYTNAVRAVQCAICIVQGVQCVVCTM